MKNVLVIGGATLDTIIAYEDMERLEHQSAKGLQSYLLIEEGQKIEVTEQHHFSGGGATNAAVSFQKQGLTAQLFCKLGRDVTGEAVLSELKSYGLNTDAIVYCDQLGTASSFVIPSLQGDRTVFAYRGANTALRAEEVPYDQLKNSDFLYITSLSRQAAEALPEIVDKAKAEGVSVAINPGISQLKLGGSFLRNALHGVDILILNYDEAKQFMASLKQIEAVPDSTERSADTLLDTSIQFEDQHFNLREFFNTVMALGPKTVTVTDGAKGVFVAHHDKLYYHKSLTVDVVNTLGAGDAFGSGFVGALKRGLSVPDAIRSGVVNSAQVIQAPDAKSGLLDLAEMEKRVGALDPGLLDERR